MGSDKASARGNELPAAALGTPTIFITAEEVAEMLSISRGAVYDLAAPKGPIPCVRLGRRLIRFKVADVQAHIVACTQSQMAPKFSMKLSRTPVKITISEPLNYFERMGIKVRPRSKRKP